MFNLECPNCQHTFGLACAKATNSKPLGVGSYDIGSGFRIEKILECCDCEKPSYQKFWREIRVVAKRIRHDANQLDLFQNEIDARGR